MGKFSSSHNNVYQELDGVLPGGIWSVPAYFNGTIYYGPVGSPIYAFQFANAKLATTNIQLVINEICGTNRDVGSSCVTRKHRQM